MQLAATSHDTVTTVARAPLPIRLGAGLSAATATYCYAIVRPSAAGASRVASAGDPALTRASAVVARFESRGWLSQRVEALLAAETGSDEASVLSAAAVALATALVAFAGVTLTADEIIELVADLPGADRNLAASALYGGLNVSPARQATGPRPLHLPGSAVAALALRLLQFETPASEQHLAPVDREAPAGSLALALERGDMNGFGRLLGTRPDNPIAAAWYDAALAAGALGGRVAGRHLLLYCPLRAQRAVRSRLGACGLTERPVALTTTGATLVGVAPAPPWPAAEPAETLPAYWRDLSAAVLSPPVASLSRAAELLADCCDRGGTIFVVGNGGSAATASHMACNLARRGRSGEWPGFRVLPLADNVSLMTAWANDTGFEHVFAEPLAAFAHPGDVVVAIAAQEESGSILAAARAARRAGATTIALTGRNGGSMQALADVVLRAPADRREHVEDIHLAMAHSLCLAVEARLDAGRVPAARQACAAGG